MELTRPRLAQTSPKSLRVKSKMEESIFSSDRELMKSVCLSVCLSVIMLNSSLNLHAVSQQSVSSQLVVF